MMGWAVMVLSRDGCGGDGDKMMMSTHHLNLISVLKAKKTLAA